MLQAPRLIRHGLTIDNYINQGSTGCCNKETNFTCEIVQMQNYIFCFYNGLGGCSWWVSNSCILRSLKDQVSFKCVFTVSWGPIFNHIQLVESASEDIPFLKSDSTHSGSHSVVTTSCMATVTAGVAGKCIMPAGPWRKQQSFCD